LTCLYFWQKSNAAKSLRPRRAAKEFYISAIWLHEAKRHTQGRCFTRAIWTQKPDNFAGMNCERHILNRRLAAKGFSYVR